MLVLAIETSGPLGSVALLESDRVLAEHSLEPGKKHAQSLLPTIRQALADCGRSPRDVGLTAVSIGPGSYTGLRVGVVCAKSFAYAVQCPLVAVDTLRAIACNSPPELSCIEVIADAQRGDLFAGQYGRNATGQWIGSSEVRVVRAEDWAAELTESCTLAGPGLEKFGALAAGRCSVLPAEFWVPSAANVARLGAHSLAAGLFADPWSIEPLYLRRSSAEVQWEKLHPGK
jgi:tRNA threonylcarbamoyladenosine biosynthesis protein TsaB